MKAIPARFAGKCSATGDNYNTGSLIVKTPSGWELVTVGNRPVILDMPKDTDETPAEPAQRPGPCDVDARSYRTAPNFNDPTITAGIIQAVAALVCQFFHR